MRNECRFWKVMLGIVLIIIMTFPANTQITRLFPVTEEVSLKTTGPPKQDMFSNDPYSEKVVYPLPPGVTRSTTSFTESTPTNLGDLTTMISSTTPTKTHEVSTVKETSPNDSNLSKLPEPSAEEPLPSNSKQSSQLSSSTEGISTEKMIQFKQESIPVIALAMTTQGPPFLNEKSTTPALDVTQIKKETSELPIDLNRLPIEEFGTSTEGIQFKLESKPVALDLTTEGPFRTEATNFKEPTTHSISDHTEATIKTGSPKETTFPDEIKTTPTKVPESIPNKPCTTPIGKSGECKDLRECPSLLNLLMPEPLLAENKLYLQQSQCGLEDHTVLTCCPDNVPEPIISPNWSLLPKPSTPCGTMHENRLYGGYSTDIDSYSWMALLEYAKGEKETGFHCGGTLISDRYVLTAAHCVTGLPKTWSIKSVRLGEWDLATTKDCSKFNDFVDCSDAHINVSIDEVISHKNYVPTSKNQLHDIALIRLATKINFTEFIEPICLPHNANNLHAFDQQGLDLVGWGASSEGLFKNVKEKVTTHVIPLNKCRIKYAENNITLEQSQFCIEGRVQNDTCRIDSGGPVISFDTSNQGLGNYYIAGIQSFGPSPCWVEGLPGVYTRVGEYLHWILENIHV